MATTKRLQELRSKFQLGDRAKTGAWVALEDPYGDPLGMAVKVISTDSAAHQRQRQRALQKFANKSQAWRDKHLREVIARFQAESVVLDWYFYDADEHDDIDWATFEKPKGGDRYSVKEMADFLADTGEDGSRSANNTIEQIDEFTREADNFRMDPDVGKSPSTSASPSTPANTSTP